ncbi:MAG: CsbD family protein [Sphingomonadaceae bacterium]|nr:CsbD family protein [Sphingomonadaceae bacterium]
MRGRLTGSFRGSTNRAIGKAKSVTGRATLNLRMFIAGERQLQRGNRRRFFGRIKGLFGNRF